MTHEEDQMTDEEKTSLMREVQKDDRAFALLTAALHKCDEGTTYGRLLAERGDPRQWPEYGNGARDD